MIDAELNGAFVDAMPDPKTFRASVETAFVTGQVWAMDGRRMAKSSLT